MNYAKLIKILREKLFMTQEEFAEYIGSTYGTVNRWENGKFAPTIKMKKKLYRLFVENRLIEEYGDIITDINNYRLPVRNIEIDDDCFNKLKEYKLEYYISDVENLGLETTWDLICEFVTSNYLTNEFLTIDKFGELYEIGLAIQDKQQKKKSGQYYTPDDVAKIMSTWFLKCDGYNICDVGCGTGNLILAFLDLVGYDEARKIIKEGRLYLYDFDRVALKICKTAISIKYGLDISDNINAVYGDFLDRNIRLPENCKVIANPPYAPISKFELNWEQTDVLEKTKEFYSAFMEKAFTQASSVVIITPFSFVSGNKFYPLRKLMCNIGNGFIISFDNVPGNIFCGRKHGIFNTNTANSVRASITVFNKSNTLHGFKTTHLIRFKGVERTKLLANKYLETLLSPEYQIVNENNPMFKKVDVRLLQIFNAWIKTSTGVLKSLTSPSGNFTISMPNTCRYFTTASNEKMNRNGQIILSFDDEDKFNFVYCLINSSFSYWHWRIYDGGITYQKGLLEDMPVFFDKLTSKDKQFFQDVACEMISKMKNFTVTKNNVGVQENIKFPREYRDKINHKILEILGVQEKEEIFDFVHSNMALEVNV